MSEGGVLALEEPGDECREPSRFLLQAPDGLKVIQAVLQRLADPKHHGSCGAQAELVGYAMYRQPLFSVALETRDAVANLIVKDLRARAGDRIQTGVHEPGDGVTDGQPADLGNIQYLRSRKAMEVELGIASLKIGKQALVVV